jgi:ankyrin repeat protein
MKKKDDNQEKILDEIRQKVLEESENLKAEKERLLNEKVTLEALKEMTELPMKRIREISSLVKNRHKEKKKQIIALAGKIVVWIIIAGIVGGIVFFITKGVIDGIKTHQENLRKQVFRKASEDYYRLINAVSTGNLEMVKYHVLEEGIPVELEGFTSDTALMYAVENSYSDIITFLLEQNADVLKKNTDGKSVMDLADEGSNIVVKKKICIALVNTTPEESPIRELWSRGHYYSEKSFFSLLDKKDTLALRLFLAADQGPYAHTYDDKGIIRAAEKGYLDIIKLLYEEGKDISPETKNVALIYASIEGHIDSIDYLLENGADINFKYDLSHYAFNQNFTPLICAIREENAAFEHLLKKGADPNLIGSAYDIVPLMIPMFYIKESYCSESRLNQIKILIAYGADVNKTSGDGETPIEFAQHLRPSESQPVTKILIDAGAEIPMTEYFFRELIFLNNLANVKVFLDYGMDPDLQGFEYYDEETTALIKAVMLGFYDLAKMLIEYGADVNYRTPDYGKTPLLMAVINEDLPMVRLLLKNGAKVNQDVLNQLKGYYTRTNDPTQNKIRSLINAHR